MLALLPFTIDRERKIEIRIKKRISRHTEDKLILDVVIRLCVCVCVCVRLSVVTAWLRLTVKCGN